MNTIGFDAATRDLRLTYNAAYAAHQSCVTALNEAIFAGKQPSQELLERETAAQRELTDARHRLLASISAAAGA